MKVCQRCGDEISTPDGENLCPECNQDDGDHTAEAKTRRAKANANRRESETLLRDLGLVKVKGVLGGTYWE